MASPITLPRGADMSEISFWIKVNLTVATVYEQFDKVKPRSSEYLSRVEYEQLQSSSENKWHSHESVHIKWVILFLFWYVGTTPWGLNKMYKTCFCQNITVNCCLNWLKLVERSNEKWLLLFLAGTLPSNVVYSHSFLTHAVQWRWQQSISMQSWLHH